MHDKRDDIQGLRAWAVIAVIVFHFFPSILPYGYLGVDVFFVLSGFLISLVLHGKPSCCATYRNFYYKRLRRILPLALVIVLICIAINYFLLTGYEFDIGTRSALHSMFFVKNLQPKRNSDEDYFRALDNANDFFTHYWSLSVEIQFYLIAPFLLHLLKHRSENHTLSAIYLTTVASASLLYHLLLPPNDVFSSTVARLWQFVMGSKAQEIHMMISKKESIEVNEECKEKKDQSRKSLIIIPVLFAVVSSNSVIFNGDMETSARLCFTYLASIILVMHTKSILLCSQLHQQIGNASYSLYLIHWPVSIVLQIYEINIWQVKLVALIGSIVLAIICHHTFEKWYLSLSTIGSFLLVGVLYTASFAALVGSQHFNVSPCQGFNDTSIQWKHDSNVSLSTDEIDKINLYLSNKCRDGFDFIPQEECNLRDGKHPFGFCDFKNGTGSSDFLIIGNSYAANLAGLIQKHFQPHYRRLKYRSIQSCEMLIPTDKPFCWDYKYIHKKIDDDVVKERPDVIFILTRFIHPDVPVQRPIEKDELFQFMENRLKFFEAHANKVFILQAFPVPRRYEILDKPTERNGYMPKSYDAIATPMKERMIKLAERCSKCVVFDIDSALVNEAGNFSVLNPQRLRYFDKGDHLTKLGLATIEPKIEKLARYFTNLINARYPQNIT